MVEQGTERPYLNSIQEADSKYWKWGGAVTLQACPSDLLLPHSSAS